MLTVHRENRELLHAVEEMRGWWPGWESFLIFSCAVFHGLIGFTLAAAPFDQIHNAGTGPVFELGSRYVWSAAFVVAAFTSTLLARRQTTPRRLLWWFTAMPLGGSWFTAFVLAVLNGRGSAIGVVVWLVMYGIWSVAGVRMALGKR